METIIATLLPILLTLMFGFFAGWHHDFNQDQAKLLNKMVLLYALPLMLFSGVISTPLSVLLSDMPIFAWIASGMVVTFLAVLLFCRFVLRASLQVSALRAVAIAGPAAPFVGPSVLGEVFPANAAAAVAVGSMLLNLVLVPMVLVFLRLGDAQGVQGAKPGSPIKGVLKQIGGALCQPLIWAPVLAFVLVACGLHIPSMLLHSMMLLGQATSGVALFAVGAILYAQKVGISRAISVAVLSKNVLLPLFVLLFMRAFGAGAGHEQAMVSIALALPTASIAVMLAVQYKVAEREMAGILFWSSVLSIATLGGFIWAVKPA